MLKDKINNLIIHIVNPDRFLFLIPSNVLQFRYLYLIWKSLWFWSTSFTIIIHLQWTRNHSTVYSIYLYFLHWLKLCMPHFNLYTPRKSCIITYCPQRSIILVLGYPFSYQDSQRISKYFELTCPSWFWSISGVKDLKSPIVFVGTNLMTNHWRLLESLSP